MEDENKKPTKLIERENNEKIDRIEEGIKALEELLGKLMFSPSDPLVKKIIDGQRAFAEKMREIQRGMKGCGDEISNVKQQLNK